jgi:Ca-activated chloride channel homolog
MKTNLNNKYRQKTLWTSILLVVLLIISACSHQDGASDVTRTGIAQLNSTTSSLIHETQVQGTQNSQATLIPTQDGISAAHAAQTTATALSNLFNQTPIAEATLGSIPTQSGNEMPQTGGGGGTPIPTPAPTTLPPSDMFFEDYGVNPFLDTEDDHLSTFAMDVDTASYTVARNYLRDSNQLPDPDSVRPEEFINYFSVDYPSPTENAFAIHLEAAPAPFGYDGHYLMQVGLQGRYVPMEERQPALLTFVIDVSGSMEGATRLGLVKDSLNLLVNNLRDDDYVSIVTYANGAKVVLHPTSVYNRETILKSIDSLHTEGSTFAEAGLRLGYDVAKSVYRDDAINRVILLSDGVANVGETGPDSILNIVADHVSRGITLSTVGFGMGNYNDVLMEQLANDGNGNYHYVDEIREARRVFVHNLTSTLQVIAYDAKVQVDFNPDVTDRYRLIGYENRAVADEDFRNDTVDAGEVGAGHSVTALYELGLDNESDGTIATVYIRYQDADTEEIVEVTQDITTSDLIRSFDETNPQWRLLAGVAEFSELLRGSYWAQDGSYTNLLAWLEPLQVDMIDNGELIELIEMIHRTREYNQ